MGGGGPTSAVEMTCVAAITFLLPLGLVQKADRVRSSVVMSAGYRVGTESEKERQSSPIKANHLSPLSPLILANPSQQVCFQPRDSQRCSSQHRPSSSVQAEQERFRAPDL